MAILVSVWLIAGYFGKTGRAELAVGAGARAVGRPPGLLVIILSVLAGTISMFVDNVVVILMMAPVALPLARALKHAGDAAGPDDRLFGQLHGLGDAAGRPAAADAAQRRRRRVHGLLLAPGPAVVVPYPDGDVRDHAGAMYVYGFRGHGARPVDVEKLGIETHIPNPLFATHRGRRGSCSRCSAMAFREVLGVKLGFIAMTGAIIAGAGARDARRAREGAAASRRSCGSSTGARSSSTSRCSRWSAGWRRRTCSTRSPTR